MYSFRIEQAIRASALLHAGQVRKGRIPYPYITHLYSVAALIADYTDDEDIVIAGLLHDAIEDTEYTLAELQEDFGKRVREIVREVSIEQVEQECSVREQWRIEHTAYVSQLKNASKEALIVASADKIHNMRSTIEEYYERYDEFREHFGGSLEERLAIYQGISNILNSKLNNDIVHEFNHVFDEYKKFIHDAKITEEKSF